MTSLRKIYALLSPAERRRSTRLLGWLTFGMLLETLGVGLVIPAMAVLTQSDIGVRYPVLRPALRALGDPSPVRLIAGGMLLLVAVYLVKAIFLDVMLRRQTRFAFDVQTELSQRLFHTYLHQPYTFHLQRNSAELISTAVTEVNVLTFHGSMPALQFVSEGLVLVGLMLLLLIVEPIGTLAAGAVTGVGAWFVYRVTRERTKLYGEARQEFERLRVQWLQQGLGAVKEVRLLGREHAFLAAYRLASVSSAEALAFGVAQAQLPRLWLELLAVSGLATVVFVMLALHRPPSDILTTLAFFGAVAFRLTPSINRVLVSAQSMRYAQPVVDLVTRELQLPVTEAGPDGTVRRFADSIRFDHVSYTYDGASERAVDDLSLEIPRGTSVGFIGTSGAGKSTVVDLMLGLLTPDAGRVVVDGQDLRDDPRTWQRQIGYVPQTLFLSDDTILRNIAFGVPDAEIDRTAVTRALRAAQLESFVDSLPAGLGTIVGERGVRLSGGQVQRIGIARALYHDPAVLVLDEATSALDTETEREVMRAVTVLRGEKTLVIVAHRHSTVEKCDQLFRLENGRLVDAAGPRGA